MYLADTNILIYAFKGFKPFASFIEREVNRDNLALSVVTVAEFLGGLSDNSQEFESFLEIVPIFDINTEIAEIAGNYRRSSIKIKKVYLLDCFVAATAKFNNLTLVTANSKDYPMKDIKIKILD